MRPLRRSATALLILAIWVAITLLGPLAPAGGGKDVLTGGVALAVLAACGFLVVATRWTGRKEIGLCRPKTWRSLVLLWFPLLVILGLAYLALPRGAPPSAPLMLLALNALLVGFSEEVMFRGVLLSGARAILSMRLAVIVSTLVFGLAHSMNVLITGDGAMTAVQTVAAVMTGTMLVAIRLRTGSLWPGIALHTLWDLLMFTIAANQPIGTDGRTESLTLMFTPLIIVLPNFLYGVMLLRRS